MAYDKKFRERVLQFIDKGHSIRETARVFGIGISTIMDWRKLRSQTGELNKRPRETAHKKIDPGKLLAYYEQTPDRYLSEAANAFDCSITAIFKAKKRLGITLKKTKRYVEKCEVKRAVLHNLISSLPKESLYYSKRH